ncbi:Glu/Leu/Phe/Val dehydrogenase dimerization domain-containing protein [Cupriavidus basilensis]
MLRSPEKDRKRSTISHRLTRGAMFRQATPTCSPRTSKNVLSVPGRHQENRVLDRLIAKTEVASTTAEVVARATATGVAPMPASHVFASPHADHHTKEVSNMIELSIPTDHELVQIKPGRRTGLPVMIGVHSTALGPAVGGLRIKRYENSSAAIADALRLSAAMTIKAAAVDNGTGVGKPSYPCRPDSRSQPSSRRRSSWTSRIMFIR